LPRVIRAIAHQKKQTAIDLFFGSAIAIPAVGDRYLSNHHIVMIEMDKIVSEKRCWVCLR
jgi:hypothetical protein